VTDLRAVPKPEGFELRQARCAKEDNTKWLPQDALYAAYEAMSKVKVERAMIVAWWESDDSGNVKLNFSAYSEHPQQNTALAAVLLGYLSSP
jgi:hypothetical protein